MVAWVLLWSAIAGVIAVALIVSFLGRHEARPECGALNGFDMACSALAFVLGLVFIVMGAFGLFVGCSAHFTLPPILGGVPALLGWGIVRSVRAAWRIRRLPPQSGEMGPGSMTRMSPPDAPITPAN